jgi:hypothetical protein
LHANALFFAHFLKTLKPPGKRAGISPERTIYLQEISMDASPDSVTQMAVAAHSSVEGIIGVMVPIVAIVMGIGVAMLGMWLDYRKKREIFELHHKERMAAIEKGMDVPPLPPELFQSNKRYGRLPSDYLRRGLVWGLAGAAVFLAMQMEHENGSWYALIAVAVGVAHLLMYVYQSRQPPAGSDPSIR